MMSVCDQSGRQEPVGGGQAADPTARNKTKLETASPALPPGADPRILAYRHHVERFDIPEGQKLELLHAVWQIMRSFVDRAFGDDPVQQVLRPRHEANPVPDHRPDTPEGNSKDDDDPVSPAVIKSSATTDNQTQNLVSRFRAPAGTDDGRKR